MKLILTILTVFIFTSSVYCQIDTLKLDTVPAFVKVNKCLTWNYYHANGVLLWGGAEYDPALVPTNGYMTQSINLKPNYEVIKGFAVIRNYSDGSMKEVTGWLDNKKKKITNRWVDPILTLR